MHYTPRNTFPEQPDQDDSPVGIVALWRLLWCNKLRILLPAFILTLLTAILVLRSPDTYTAEAQMLLARGNLEIVEFDSAGDIEVTQGAIINALTILGSRSLALQVIERLDLTNDPEVNPNIAILEDDPEAEIYPDSIVRQFALDWLASITQVSILPGTNVIVLRATTTVPEKSAAIANAYLDAYLDYQLERGQSETERAAGALRTRVNELRLRLEADQALLQDYSAGATSSAMESANDLAGETVNVRSRLESTQASLDELDAALAVLNATSASDFQAVRDALDQNETLLRMERTNLGRAIGADTLAQDVETLLGALQTERSRFEQLNTALRNGLDAIEERIAEANAFMVGLRQLEVEVETTSQVYESSLARLKELSIQTGLRDAGAQVLATAEAPLRTDAQGRRRMVAIAAVLGLFIGIAHVLVREAANDRVRRVSELAEITGSDCVVQLPSAHGDKGGKNLSGTLDLSSKEASPFLDGIRALRHRLVSSADATGPLVAGVFSSLPSEGKSLVTQALAHSFSKIDRSVIVVDGDMRSGTLSKSLGITPDQPGLHEVIAGEVDPSDAIITQSSGFDLLPSGQSQVNPADLLEVERFSQLIEALRQRYEIIIFDTPPVLSVPDASRIAAHLNAHVLVTAYDRSPRAAVRETVAALESAKVERHVVAFCDAPEAFGKNYGASKGAFARYWT